MNILFQHIFNINHSKILFDPPSRVMEIKTKVNKWDLMKLKSFCTAKDAINKMKRKLSEWEKTITNKQLTKDSSPKYTSSSCSSVSEKQTLEEACAFFFDRILSQCNLAISNLRLKLEI